MKKTIIGSLIFVLLAVFSFGFSACSALHSHKWSAEWSKDQLYHWHAPLCKDTDEVKDKAEHSIANGDCTVCGYHITLKDTGEKYGIAVKPVYDIAKTILNDLVQSGEITLGAERNAEISSIRFTGVNFVIFIKEDIFVAENGEKCEFLKSERGITLKNFSEADGETYSAYREFILAERNFQCLENYEEAVLPYAQRCADMIYAQYKIYKNSPEKEISADNYGKDIVLSADSSLSEVYGKITENLNGALEKRGYPLITNQSLEIGFGGNVNWAIKNRWIIIQVTIGNLKYSFYLSFNKDGEFTEEYINHFTGSVSTGYEWNDPDISNAENEEYAEFFKRLKIEEIDLSNIQDSYAYKGNGCALYDPYGETTYTHFDY